MCLRLTFWVRKDSYLQFVLMDGAGTVLKGKVLMLGANPLVRDNVLILLGAMAYHCVFAPSLKEALVLHEKEKPDAAILDPQQADSSPAGTVAAFHRKFPGLRGRTIVLTGEQATPELLKVLDAYSLPQVPLHLLRQELWPCLDSLLTRNIVPQQVTGNARLVFDSFLHLHEDHTRASIAGTTGKSNSERRASQGSKIRKGGKP